MLCPHCQTPNDDQAKHCSNCGRSLVNPEDLFGQTKIKAGADLGSSSEDYFGETEVRPDEPADVFREGDLIAGRYRVVRPLGQGGMGVVYQVEDIELNFEKRAIKVILPHLLRHEEARRRFTEEVSICQKLTHTNIVRVHDLKRDGDRRFFTMEYVDGRSLRDEMESRRARDEKFSLAEAARVTGQVLDALSHAHQFTVHRDVTPENIMLIGPWPDVKVKVMDFGIAKMMSPTRFTTTAQSMGKAGYMSPEQLRGAKDVQGSSDLFSVGVVFYEMLTGEMPMGAFQPLSELVPLAPAGIDALLNRALAPRPENRFATADEFQAALTEVAAEAERLRQEEEERLRRAEAEKRRAEEERLQKEAEEKQRQEEQRRAEEERLRQEAKRRPAAEPEQVKAEEPVKSRRKIGWLIAAALAVVVVVGGYLGITWYQNKVAEEKRIAAQRRAEEARRRAAARKAAKPKPALKPAKPKPVAKPAAKPTPEPVKAKKYFTNSIDMKFVLVPAGSFVMGSRLSVDTVLRKYVPAKYHKWARTWLQNEHPRHRVVISRPFYLQTTEVTQAQYRKIMGKNPSRFKNCVRCPVEWVSWHDAQEFIRKLNAREKTNKYRLPTEAEWEYACRAGSRTVFSFGDDLKRLGEYAWYRDNSGRKTHPVGQKKPNAWGLYDMHGNVWEWCSDRYGKDYYKSSPGRDPKGPNSGKYRVLRGGSWGGNPGFLRSASRFWFDPRYRNLGIGFRVLRISF